MNKDKRLFELFDKLNGTKLTLKENTGITKEQFYSANNIDVENLSYLGKGDFGTAYSIGDGRVMKITSSKSEFDIAKELIENQGSHAFDGFADFYVAEIVDGKMVIIMEELEEDSHIEDLFSELTYILDEHDLPIQYLSHLDTDEVELSDEMKSFINDVEDINYGYRALGIEASDIRSENMGRSKDGKVKAFDIEDKRRHNGW
jgi:hypothetical protein